MANIEKEKMKKEKPDFNYTDYYFTEWRRVFHIKYTGKQQDTTVKKNAKNKTAADTLSLAFNSAVI